MSAAATDLRAGALGLGQSLAIGLDSTAPAYSLAAVLGVLVAGVGLQAPALLLVAFVPIFLTALGYRELNRVEPDCGTTYPWVSRALGAHTGWVAGFLVTITGVVVVGSLADVAATYGLELVGLEGAAGSDAVVVAVAIALIAAMAAVAAAGIEPSARMQAGLAVVQFAGLLFLAGGALAAGGGPAPSLGWLNPFAIPLEALPAALVVAVFVYWGWESTTSVNEETAEPHAVPGAAAVLSTVVLLVTYALVAVAVLSHLGTGAGERYEDDVAILGDVAEATLPGPLSTLVLVAVVVSALATTHTTILPGSRTALSMARRGALPRVFARVHPRTLTPARGTWVLAAASVAWYVPARLLDEDFLANTITGLGLLIALYYGLTALAAPLVVRARGRRLLTAAVLPALGAVLMFVIFVLAAGEFAADGGLPLIAGLVLIGVAALGAPLGARRARLNDTTT